MNIGGVSQSNNTLIIDGNSLRESTQQSGQIELKNGSSIQGTVVSITDTPEGKIANVNVGDTVISAKLSEGMGLREGQTLNFSVRAGSGSTVSIIPLYENTSLDQNTLKALTAAGIEVSNDTINMVKDMMEAGLPINKDALLEMNKAITSYPNNSISTMVEMKALNIPINDVNIQQFESYKNYEHQVSSAMENIMDELPGAFHTMVQSGNEQGAVNLYGSVLELFASDTGTIEKGVSDQAVQAKEAANAEALNTLADTGNTADNASAAGGLNSAVNTTASDGTNVSNNAAAAGESARTVLSDGFIDTLKNLGISDEAINKYTAALKETSAASQELLSAEGSGNEAMTSAARSHSESANALLESAQKDLLKELANAFKASDLTNTAEAASWKKLFSGDEYNKLLKDNISSQWLLKPTDVEKKENVDNLYQRLQNQVKELTGAITQNLGAESKLAQTANNLQNNLDFMNQLNQMFQYVQLPLQMAGQNAHGDLYVYRNKNRKMSEDGSVSAVLHLDMENLGPVDVYVKMIETKVSTNFYVADEGVLDLINDNIHILNERLEKRGYSMKVNMALHDDKDISDAAVDEMLNVNRSTIMSVNSFDARA